MKDRMFIQTLLLLLAAGCFLFGMMLTLTVLMLSIIVIEIIEWTRLLECRDNYRQHPY
jgi:phage-related holin